MGVLYRNRYPTDRTVFLVDEKYTNAMSTGWSTFQLWIKPIIGTMLFFGIFDVAL